MQWGKSTLFAVLKADRNICVYLGEYVFFSFVHYLFGLKTSNFYKLKMYKEKCDIFDAEFLWLDLSFWFMQISIK